MTTPTSALNATSENLETLARACGPSSPRPPAVVLRIVCTSCGDRFFGTKLTPSICPSCSSHEVVAHEKQGVA